MNLMQRFTARQVLAMLGLPGLLGLVLLAWAAWWHWGEQPLAAQALQTQQDEAATLRDQLARASTQQAGEEPAAHAPSPDKAWQSLWQNLPDAQAGGRMQAAVLALAGQHQVAIGAVQFQGEAWPGVPGVWRQRITVPVQTTYPALRAWLNAVLQMPDGGSAVSLDALEISRTDVMNDTVKARVVWSLWWRAAP